MTAAPARVPRDQSWTAAREHTVTGTVRRRGADRYVAGRGPGLEVHDRTVDEVAVRRVCQGAHVSADLGLSFGNLTVAERREVVSRLRARRWTSDRIAKWVGVSDAVIQAYDRWIATGEWVPPQRLKAVREAERAAAEVAAAEPVDPAVCRWHDDGRHHPQGLAYGPGGNYQRCACGEGIERLGGYRSRTWHASGTGR